MARVRQLVADLGNSAADITVELSSKTLQNTVTLSTRSSAWIVPKYIAGRPGDTVWKTSPYLPLSWQRKAIQAMAPFMGVDPRLYGLPEPKAGTYDVQFSAQLDRTSGGGSNTTDIWLAYNGNNVANKPVNVPLRWACLPSNRIRQRCKRLKSSVCVAFKPWNLLVRLRARWDWVHSKPVRRLVSNSSSSSSIRSRSCNDWCST